MVNPRNLVVGYSRHLYQLLRSYKLFVLTRSVLICQVLSWKLQMLQEPLVASVEIP